MILFRKSFVLSLLFMLCSCIFLSRWSVVHYDESKYVISVIGIKILSDGVLQTKTNGLGNWCRLRFADADFRRLKYRNDENMFFYVIKSPPGKTRFDSLKCRKHSVPFIFIKKRVIYLDRWVFNARPGYINYVGNLTIDYRPQGFMIADLFGLGSLKPDYGGTVDIRTEDRINEARAFLNRNYPEFNNKKLIRSFPYDPANSSSSNFDKLPPVPIAMRSNSMISTQQPTIQKSTYQPVPNQYQRGLGVRNPGYYYQMPAQNYNPYQNYYGTNYQNPPDNDSIYIPTYRHGRTKEYKQDNP